MKGSDNWTDIHLDATGRAREELATIHKKVTTNELTSSVSGMKESDNWGEKEREAKRSI